MLGQVLFLVTITIGFGFLSSVIGRALTEGAARACSIAGFGMLIDTWLVDAFRRGPLGIGWV